MSERPWGCSLVCIYWNENRSSSASGVHTAPLSGIDERARKSSAIKLLQPEAIHCSPRSKHFPFPHPKAPVCPSPATSRIGGTRQVAVVEKREAPNYCRLELELGHPRQVSLCVRLYGCSNPPTLSLTDKFLISIVRLAFLSSVGLPLLSLRQIRDGQKALNKQGN